MHNSSNTKSKSKIKMAKSFTIAAFVLCFSSLLISAYAADYLDVEGKVYCDPCRVEFQTKISEGIPGKGSS